MSFYLSVVLSLCHSFFLLQVLSFIWSFHRSINSNILSNEWPKEWSIDTTAEQLTNRWIMTEWWNIRTPKTERSNYRLIRMLKLNRYNYRTTMIEQWHNDIIRKNDIMTDRTIDGYTEDLNYIYRICHQVPKDSLHSDHQTPSSTLGQ